MKYKRCILKGKMNSIRTLVTLGIPWCWQCGRLRLLSTTQSSYFRFSYPAFGSQDEDSGSASGGETKDSTVGARKFRDSDDSSSVPTNDINSSKSSKADICSPCEISIPGTGDEVPISTSEPQPVSKSDPSLAKPLDNGYPSALKVVTVVPGKGKPPEPPVTCCGTGCANCVWIVYAEELRDYYKDGGEQARKALENIEDPSLKAFIKLELGL